MEKISKLREFLGNHREAVLISSEDNRRYFTSFPSSDGYLLVTTDDAVFFTDCRYIEAAEKSVVGCRALPLTSVGEEINKFIREKGILKIYTEKARLSISTGEHFKRVFFPRAVIFSDKLEKHIDEIRSVKDADEVSCIKKAQAIAEDAFNHILGFIKPGITEKQIALELDFYMLSHGAEAVSFETIAVTGAKSSMPHGVPDDTIVKDGDFITLDFGAVYKGYHSDMTRTIAVGSVSDEQRKVYEIVLSAQKASLAVLKSGLSCKEADAAARDIIKSAGYGQYFGHSTGHGVGVEIHESPALSPNSKKDLCVGNVVTVEPGIYLPGKFGVRIEDMALITEDGCENLTSTPKELMIL